MNRKVDLRMRKFTVCILLIWCLVLFIGCQYRTAKSTPIGDAPNVPEKTHDAKIDVYKSEDNIDREYTELCLIDGYNEGTIGEMTTFMELIENEVKREARKCGADAIIIKDRERPDLNTLSLSAIAIRYKDSGMRR